MRRIAPFLALALLVAGCVGPGGTADPRFAFRETGGVLAGRFDPDVFTRAEVQRVVAAEGCATGRLTGFADQPLPPRMRGFTLVCEGDPRMRGAAYEVTRLPDGRIVASALPAR